MVVTNTGYYMFPDAMHSFNDLWEQPSPGMLFACYLILQLIGALFIGIRAICRSVSDYDIFKDPFERMVVEQDLKSFFAAMRPKHLKGWIKEETVCQKKLHMQRYSASTWQQLNEHEF